MATTTPTPYLKLGRGGAGNYLPPTTQPLQHAPNSSLSPTAADIESQPPTQPVLTTTAAAAAAKGEQAAATAEYAHSGRGGAGNWFSPRELDATGTFVTTAPPPPSSSSLGTAVDGMSCSSTAMAIDDRTAFQAAAAPASASASSVPVTAGPTYYGRGGAGNFNARCVEEGRRGRRVEEEEERERERERRREEVGEMVRREVERGLRRPEGAYLRGGGGRAVEVEEV